MNNKFAVITTINEKSRSIIKFESFSDWHIVVVGDDKTPPMKNSNNLTYLSINDQYKKYYDMAKSLPHNHYCRKNIGYLFAINS
ncbi:hypothetical protein, partial [Schnuerera sp.]|uniref:hypothetical protein n=1 Tax=Schnuerera sp. TaxID=2794844 RepID=UPI002BC81992